MKSRFSSTRVVLTLFVLASALGGCATSGSAGAGSAEPPSDQETVAMKKVGGEARGQIVWSSSRNGNHDIFVMDTDGSHVRALTKGDNVDWFPRFSPDGQRILFTRSKKGWVFERDANTDGKWDIFSMARRGGDERKEVDNASWGTWISDEEIAFARGTAVFKKKLGAEKETLLVDSSKIAELDGALLQQPEISADGRWLALTLRGSKRETGIWNLRTRAWHRSGDGCQINWEPNGKSIYWVHPTGSGGSRILHCSVDNGKADTKGDDVDKLTLIDLPGRRSHEYFPQLSRDGHWLVWAATQRGHDHDIADYELYLWKVGSPDSEAVRLTYHTGNDRWPDIYLGSDAATSPSSSGSASEPAEETAAAKDEANDEAQGDAQDTKTRSTSSKGKRNKGRGGRR